MEKSILKLSACKGKATNCFYRTIFTTKHGRKILLLVRIDNNKCIIQDCFYIDRSRNRIGEERYRSKPLKLRTFECSMDKLLNVIDAELDKKFFGVEFVNDKTEALSTEEYIQARLSEGFSKYNFLIFVGEGEQYNGLPVQLRTRLKNTLHRSIYVDLRYHKNGQGVVNECYYYDRTYRRQGIRITPPQLISCFFPYTTEGILILLNNEICCKFTHILITSEINIDSNPTPLCGAI